VSWPDCQPTLLNLGAVNAQASHTINDRILDRNRNSLVSFCSYLAAAPRRAKNGEDKMTLKRFVTSTAIAVAVTLPSMAYAEDAYYVVQDVKTKKCTIVDKKPVATEYTTVGPDGVIYKTRTEAEAAMKTVKVCTTQ
jgi:hypothetical protein